MADSKITNLTEATTIAAADVLPIVDIDDATMAASGTTKKITRTNFIGTISLTEGGTGQASAQSGINALTQSASATDNYVLTKNSGGDAVWASAPGAGGGESNTGSNVGTAGVGVFKQKTGVDLEFKKINAASAAVVITDDTANSELDIGVNINDSGTAATDLWSGSKINTELGGKSASSHTHSYAAQGANGDITSMTGLDDDGIPLAKVDDAAGLSADQSWTGSQRATPVAVTPSTNIATFDLNAGQNFTCTTDSGASTQLTFSNLTTGQSGFIKLSIPSAAGGGVTLNSIVKSPGGSGATDLSVVDKTHLVSYMTDGTNVYITYGISMA